MRKAQIAELTLSLVTSRERAASAAGDLMEDASRRGAWWFWSSVSRTALSLFWGSFTAEPFFIAGIGFRGLMLNLSLYLPFFISLVSFAALFGLIVGLGLHFVAPSTVSGSSLGLPRFLWAFRLAGWIAPFAINFQTGRWIARRARNREMAACTAFLIVDTIVMPIVGEMLFGGRWSGVSANSSAIAPVPDITGASIMISNLMFAVALFAGAIWVRFALSREQRADPIC